MASRDERMLPRPKRLPMFEEFALAQRSNWAEAKSDRHCHGVHAAIAH